MFADYTSVLITDNSQGELLQRFKNVLNNMSKWFQAKWLTLNPTKTEVLIFTSAKLSNALNLTYVDHLMEVKTIKLLGLQLDNQITWKKHSTFAQEIEFCLLPHEVIMLRGGADKSLVRPGRKQRPNSVFIQHTHMKLNTLLSPLL